LLINLYTGSLDNRLAYSLNRVRVPIVIREKINSIFLIVSDFCVN
jgi:hypothetical protein